MMSTKYYVLSYDKGYSVERLGEFENISDLLKAYNSFKMRGLKDPNNVKPLSIEWDSERSKVSRPCFVATMETFESALYPTSMIWENGLLDVYRKPALPVYYGIRFEKFHDNSFFVETYGPIDTQIFCSLLNQKLENDDFVINETNIAKLVEESCVEPSFLDVQSKEQYVMFTASGGEVSVDVSDEKEFAVGWDEDLGDFGGDWGLCVRSDELYEHRWQQVVNCGDIDLDKLREKAQIFYDKLVDEGGVFEPEEIRERVTDLILSCEG